jgi:hypothetical protein
VGVCDGEGIGVAVSLGTGVGVCVAVGVGVDVEVAVGVAVGVSVGSGVVVGVSLGVAVLVGEGVRVGVGASAVCVARISAAISLACASISSLDGAQATRLNPINRQVKPGMIAFLIFALPSRNQI